MNALHEWSEQPSINEEITVVIHFTDGTNYTQTLPIDDAHGVQLFMDWFRDPGKGKVWTWHNPVTAKSILMNHRHILTVDVEGYIEPGGRHSKWHERTLDWIKARWTLWRI